VDGLELIRDLRGEMSRATQNRRASNCHPERAAFSPRVKDPDCLHMFCIHLRKTAAELARCSK
jgi:hypothetical protein